MIKIPDLHRCNVAMFCIINDWRKLVVSTRYYVNYIHVQNWSG